MCFIWWELQTQERWVRIFLTITSPDEWAITKQACRDESIVSLFFPLSQHISALPLRIEHCKRKNQCTDLLYIYIFFFLDVFYTIIRRLLKDLHTCKEVFLLLSILRSLETYLFAYDSESVGYWYVLITFWNITSTRTVNNHKTHQLLNWIWKRRRWR